MRSILITLLLLVVLPFTSKAQKFEFNGEFLLFREAKTKQPVLIIDDSLVYKGNVMKRIAFKHTEYPAKLQEYKFFNIGTKTYLVHDGCGPVLEFRNDSIVRIDNSFLHRNQYGAVRFVYNNEIYFYGGYGLFTYKNILTKYNFKNKEWIEVRTFSEEPLETRAGAFSYLINNDLFIFGGERKDENNILGRKQLNNSIMQLHLSTMKWRYHGEAKGITNADYIKNGLYYNDQENIYLITNEFNIVNPKKNTIKKYEINFTSTIYSYYFEGNNIICVSLNNLNQSKYFTILPINAVKGKQLSTSAFVSLFPHYDSSIIILTLILALCILLFILRKKITPKLKPLNSIVYNQQKGLFLFKNKPITIFDEQEKRLLLYLIEQNNQFISLNNLNQIFENNGNAETISATVKRREQTVSRLLTKVSKITGIDEKELLVERKNSEDKRIKDLKILPNLLKMV
jgi:hypothetical protein